MSSRVNPSVTDESRDLFTAIFLKIYRSRFLDKLGMTISFEKFFCLQFSIHLFILRSNNLDIHIGFHKLASGPAHRFSPILVIVKL